MNKSKGSIAKMSEVNIWSEYSSYLQQVYVHLENEKLVGEEATNSVLLNYDEFKEYYIMGLIGKDNFLDNLVHDYQFGPSVI